MNASNSFDEYAIVELFGHQIIAGKVSEQVIGGQGFVRVDVPAVDGQEPFSKLYGSGAIYAITPTDEATCLAAVQGLRKKPLDVWKLNLPQLTVESQDKEGDGFWDEDELDDEHEDELDDEAPF